MLEPVLNPALPSYTVYSSSLPPSIPVVLWASFPLSFMRFCNTRISSNVLEIENLLIKYLLYRNVVNLTQPISFYRQVFLRFTEIGQIFHSIFLIKKNFPSYKASSKANGTGQYPVWMTQKPRKGDFRKLKSKKFPRRPCPQDPPEILRLRRSLNLENRSVFMLDPHNLNFICHFLPWGAQASLYCFGDQMGEWEGNGPRS